MNNFYMKNVVIIGGGPAGLGAALMLAKRGWTDITVLEKRPSADYYEPDKSFSYQIDGRGQKLTDLLELTPKLANLSVPSTEFYLTLIKKDGTRKTTKLPIADANRKTAYWLPRASFVQLLYHEPRTANIITYPEHQIWQLKTEEEVAHFLNSPSNKGVILGSWFEILL